MCFQEPSIGKRQLADVKTVRPRSSVRRIHLVLNVTEKGGKTGLLRTGGREGMSDSKSFMYSTVSLMTADNQKLKEAELEHLHHEVRVMKFMRHAHTHRQFRVMDTMTSR